MGSAPVGHDELGGTGGVDDAAFLARLIASLPAGALVIDGAGDVRYASPDAAALVEREPDEIVGESVLSFVDADTAWAWAAAIAMAGDFSDVVIGPLRITVVSASGRHRVADLWAMNRLDDPLLAGIVCLLTPATTATGLAEAMTGIAGDLGFTTVAARVVRAMQGYPTTAEAALLATASSGFVTVGDPSCEDLPDMTGDGPWADAVATGARQLPESLDELSPELADAAREAGYATVWAEPVGTGEPPSRGVLVLWRRMKGKPTPNELNAMHQGAAILAIAWDRHENTA